MSDTKTTETLIPQPCQGWSWGDGLYPVLRDAQKAALEAVIGENLQNGIRGDIAGLLLDRATDVLRILSLKAPKERKPRSDRGTKRTRKIAPVAPAAAQPNPAVESTVTGSGKYKNR